MQKVSDASGAKYGGASTPTASGPPPVAAKKPVFTPTQVGGGGGGFNPLGRSRAPASKQDTDADGWGADAPQLSRTQLEKVDSAYKPTKVNMAELTSNKPESSRYQAPQSQNTPPDVVRGAYQPIGKVDIAAIRAQSKAAESRDDRPTVVKGAYEPVGKVDIAAIRAKAQGAPSISPAATGASGRSNDEDERPKPVSERSSAFTQPERLTSLPKPKVANKFGGASTFTGTKAPTPSPFGVKSAAPAPIVGSASKTFADQGGKTPAQLWAEKKAAQGGSLKSPSATGGNDSPSIQTQKSGDGGWKSGYTGKSWAPISTTRTGQSATSNLSEQRTGGEPQQEEPSSPAGGVSALKDRFKGAAPMGAPTSRPEPSDPSPPPPMDMSSKPNAGARGVPMPGLPSRPAEPDSDDDVPAVQHQRLPSPPPQPPRSPSPEPSGSPVRIAMPVARGREPEEMSPAEEKAPPMPTRSLDHAANQARDLSPEPQVEARDPARSAGAAVAAATFGAGAVAGAGLAAAATSGGGGGGGGGGQRAQVQYDYEKAEDNEIELREGEYVTNIDMVDEDWWIGTNAQGEQGLFPANYVELVEGGGDVDDEATEDAPPLPSHSSAAQEEPPSAPPQTSGGAGPTATAIYDYEAAEDNELSFPEGATITQVVSLTQHCLVLSLTLCRNSPMTTGGWVRTTAHPVCSLRTTLIWTNKAGMIKVAAASRCQSVTFPVQICTFQDFPYVWQNRLSIGRKAELQASCQSLRFLFVSFVFVQFCVASSPMLPINVCSVVALCKAHPQGCQCLLSQNPNPPSVTKSDVVCYPGSEIVLDSGGFTCTRWGSSSTSSPHLAEQVVTTITSFSHL